MSIKETRAVVEVLAAHHSATGIKFLGYLGGIFYSIVIRIASCCSNEIEDRNMNTLTHCV